MANDPVRNAITLALRGEWEQAIDANLQILKYQPDDTGAHMRIARAMYEMGKVKTACEYLRAVIEIDPLHKLALRCYEEWTSLEEEFKGDKNGKVANISYMFLEEPGRTKIVKLTHLSEPKVIRKLKCGEEVFLSAGGYKLLINNIDGEYVGRIADDLAVRIVKLMEGGNEYAVFVKSIQQDEVKVFLRERVRSEKNANVLSFPIRR